MKEKNHNLDTSLSIQTMDRIPSLVEDGLQAVVLCDHGTGRSRTLTERLSRDPSKRAVHIVGGLGNLQLLLHSDPKEAKRKLQFLSTVPFVFLTIEPEEERKFKNVIDIINSFRQSKTIAVGTSWDKAFDAMAPTTEVVGQLQTERN